MNGELVGIGVGVGDPEMLTLKAVKYIRESDVICIPRKDKNLCRAYQIAREAVPEIEEKQVMGFDFEMLSDRSLIQRKHNEIYENIKGFLCDGKRVSFLTIGDPTIYSTFSYISKLAERDYFNIQIINGINSFCASAARLGISLVEGKSSIYIITSRKELENTITLSGTKVFMKCSGFYSDIIKYLRDLEKEKKQSGSSVEMYAVADCGMPQEKVYHGVEQMPEEAAYMMTIIVKGS